ADRQPRNVGEHVPRGAVSRRGDRHGVIACTGDGEAGLLHTDGGHEFEVGGAPLPRQLPQLRHLIHRQAGQQRAPHSDTVLVFVGADHGGGGAHLFVVGASLSDVGVDGCVVAVDQEHTSANGFPFSGGDVAAVEQIVVHTRPWGVDVFVADTDVRHVPRREVPVHLTARGDGDRGGSVQGAWGEPVCRGLLGGVRGGFGDDRGVIQSCGGGDAGEEFPQFG